MPIFNKPYTFQDGTTAEAAEVNADFDTLYNGVNGQLTNDNISASAAISPSKIAGGVSASVRGTFVNSGLTLGVLTITHSKALSAPYSIDVKIFDNTAAEIIPDSITGTTNTVLIDLTSYGTLSGTWGYVYIG